MKKPTRPIKPPDEIIETIELYSGDEDVAVADYPADAMISLRCYDHYDYDRYDYEIVIYRQETIPNPNLAKQTEKYLKALAVYEEKMVEWEKYESLSPEQKKAMRVQKKAMRVQKTRRLSKRIS